MSIRFTQQLFYLNAWTIGFREIEGSKTELPTIVNKAKYQLIPLNDHTYYADPFVIEDGGETYLFAESMNRYRGIASISVAKYENGRFGKFREIIREPFHMSYPNVFKYKNEYYMVPETSGAGQIRLYKSTEFPYKWELCKVLLENGNAYTDNAIEIIDDSILIYTYYESAGKKAVELYQLNTNDYSLTLIQSNHFIQNDRPAGNPFFIGSKGYRPMQDCEEDYGKAIKVYSHNDFEDEDLAAVINENCYDIEIKNINGTHTLNRSEHFEVIDIKFDRFCLTRRWIWLINKFARNNKGLLTVYENHSI